VGQPILDRDGVLSIGYAYPNANVAERYTTPGSPYWAFKAFLPLALAEDHPFWTAEEAPLPDRPVVRVQPQAGLVFCEDEHRRHHFCLSSGQSAPRLRHGPAKYGKFAYSTAFGFNLVGNRSGEEDSMLVLVWSDDLWRGRSSAHEVTFTDKGVIRSRWSPGPDVDVVSWLVPLPPWHLRIHRLRSARPLRALEGGFAVGCAVGHGVTPSTDAGPGFAIARGETAWSGIKDLLGDRLGRVVSSEPNANVLHPQSAFPVLDGPTVPAEQWLASAVCALPEGPVGAEWARVPTFSWTRIAPDGGYLARIEYGGTEHRLDLL
jgi:hypothetical protein